MSQSDSPHPPGALASMLGEPLVARLAHVSRRAGPGVVGSTGLWRLQQEPLSGLPKSRAPKCGQRLGGSRIGVLEGKTWHWPGRKKAMEWPSGTHVQGRVALVKAGVDQAPGSPSHKRKQQGPVGGSRNPELHTHTHTRRCHSPRCSSVVSPDHTVSGAKTLERRRLLHSPHLPPGDLHCTVCGLMV